MFMTTPDLGSDTGASAVEYGLLVAGIAALIMVILFALGGGTDGLMTGGCDAFNVDGTTRCLAP